MIQKEKMRNEQETISIEEYLNRRRKLREKERRNRKEQTYEKESSPWMLAELSMTSALFSSFESSESSLRSSL